MSYASGTLPSGGSFSASYGSGMAPPGPPGGFRPLPFSDGKGKGKGKSDASGRSRTYFKLADEVLGARCPPVLKNVYIPAGMKFYTQGKTLADQAKMRDHEFPHLCKMCGKGPPDVKGHEAFECMEQCSWNGLPAMGARQIFQLGLGVISANGEYQ